MSLAKRKKGISNFKEMYLLGKSGFLLNAHLTPAMNTVHWHSKAHAKAFVTINPSLAVCLSKRT